MFHLYLFCVLISYLQNNECFKRNIYHFIKRNFIKEFQYFRSKLQYVYWRKISFKFYSFWNCSNSHSFNAEILFSNHHIVPYCTPCFFRVFEKKFHYCSFISIIEFILPQLSSFNSKHITVSSKDFICN